MFTPRGIHKKRFLAALLLSLAAGFSFLTLRVAAAPALPVINTNNVVNVTAFGAVGDGVTTNTVAIQNAINAAAAGGTTNGAAGGTVEFPAGIFLSGPLTLKSAVNLQLDGGAILRMLPFGQYPVTWTTNSTEYFFVANNFLSGSSLHDFEISGSGWIQGQGEPWWPWADTNNAVRPIMLKLNNCNRTLIQSVTLSNSPEFHIAISGGGNSTVQGVTVRANPSSDPLNPGHNTDACDVSGTNILVQNNDISVGDDNYTCGGGTSGMLLTNNTYGYGHGVSIGSFTSPTVSNMTVINCTFTNTTAGLRIKTDRDRGGYVHDISYYNLSMSNVQNPILIYTEYTNTLSIYRAVDSISPAVAASYSSAPVTSTTPRYRNITISNLTGTAQSGRAAGLIWGLPESSISNVTLINVHLTGSKTFGIYDAKNVRIIDSSHSVPSGVSQFSFYNADVTFSGNSTPSANIVTLDGATTNGIANKFSFYNALPTLKNTNAIGLNTSITLGASTFTISNNLALTPSNALNFILGTSPAMMVVNGDLALGGTNNIIAGNGFTAGTYTLMTYTGTLSGSPSLGSAPNAFTYVFDTSTPGQVNLIVSPPAPEIPANLSALATNLAVNLSWSTTIGASSYNLKRSTTNGGAYSHPRECFRNEFLGHNGESGGDVLLCGGGDERVCRKRKFNASQRCSPALDGSDGVKRSGKC